MEYMDTVPTDRFLKHLREIDWPVDKDIAILFNGGQSNDFYLGMISGMKAYFNIISHAGISQSFEDGLTHISLDLNKVIIQHIS